MMGIVQLSDTAANLLYSDRDSSWNIIRTIVFNDKQLRRSKYRGFTNTTDSSSADIIFETVRFLEIPIWRCFYKGISLQNIVFLCCFVFLKFFSFHFDNWHNIFNMTPTFVERETNLVSGGKAVSKSQGQGISPRYYEHEPWLLSYKKQKENKTKRTSSLYNSPPTNCIYPAIWNFSDSPEKVSEVCKPRGQHSSQHLM